ncbi:hypothetical protein [Vreelandella arcis]|uniref:Uncharacterized protein n=1 Tax=Vreelandella arcis TaxID=416873 RepID=A0A1H0H7U8_9GAMM|nr:hypothetical protein [Halomonas arcis]SDO15212.1 hypothetical protein SAMN04487951_11481 [Halomonas arcis]
MENLPVTVYVALGAIAAAFISGFWSLVNLIISKDQKVSEFRQSWIDSLRQEVSEFSGSLLSLNTSWLYFSATHGGEDVGNEFVRQNVERINKIESQRTSIFLRLNPNEHTELISQLEDLERMYTSPNSLQSGSFNTALEHFVEEVQKELKKEWERVKSGEKSFRYTRNFLLASFIFAGLAGIYLIKQLYA